MLKSPKKSKVNILYTIITNDNFPQEKMCQFIEKEIAENQNCLHELISGNSILHLAIQLRLSTVAIFLIDKGSNIDLPNNLAETPLFLAICHKLPTVATALIEKNCIINFQNNQRETPLFLAICHKLPTVATALIEKGCDINAQNDFGMTPLFIAIEMLPEIAEYLINHKCSRSLTDNFGEGPVHYAAKHNAPQILKLLIKLNQSLTLQNINGETPLHLAAKYNAIVSLLILCRQTEVKKYINTVDVDNETPLHKAVHSRSRESIKILVSQSSLDVEIPNKDKKTAKELIYSLELKDNERIKLLNAFKAMPVGNSKMADYEKKLFRSPEDPKENINEKDIEEIKTQFKALKLGSPFKAKESGPLRKDENLVITEEDILCGRMEKIDIFLLNGGDPNTLILPKNMPMLFLAFIYKQPLIFLKLIRSGATLGDKKIIEQIEMIMFHDENGLHAQFIFDMYQQLFASTENEIKLSESRLNIASKKLEKALEDNRLISWFYDGDIARIPITKIDKLLKDEELKNCIKSLYDLCSGKIDMIVPGVPEKLTVKVDEKVEEKVEVTVERKVDEKIEENVEEHVEEKVEGKVEKKVEGNVEETTKVKVKRTSTAIRYFDNLYIKTCISGLLDQYEPDLILEALIELSTFKLYNIQKLICLYILQEVIILNLEFRYTISEQFHDKLEAYLESNNYNNILSNAMLALYKAANKHNSVYNSYCQLGKLTYKYPLHQNNSIVKEIKDIVLKKIGQYDEIKCKKFAKFFAMQIRILSLQFFACDLKEYRKAVWEDQKPDREINAPNIVIFLNRLQALSTFVSLQISSPEDEQHRLNAFSLFTYAANYCLLISDKIGPDFNSAIAILGGLLPHEKECLFEVNKNVKEIYEDLCEINNPKGGFKNIRKVLKCYPYPLPFLSTKFQDKLHSKELLKMDNAGALSTIGELYSSFHRINTKLLFLPKIPSTDLLFLLSKIIPNRSIISEYYKIAMPGLKVEKKEDKKDKKKDKKKEKKSNNRDEKSLMVSISSHSIPLDISPSPQKDLENFPKTEDRYSFTAEELDSFGDNSKSLPTSGRKSSPSIEVIERTSPSPPITPNYSNTKNRRRHSTSITKPLLSINPGKSLKKSYNN